LRQWLVEVSDDARPLEFRCVNRIDRPGAESHEEGLGKGEIGKLLPAKHQGMGKVDSSLRARLQEGFGCLVNHWCFVSLVLIVRLYGPRQADEV
jgi:hypothetical protein